MFNIEELEFSCFFNERLSFKTRCMLNAPGLYKLTNITNGKFYLGIATNLSTRYRSHVNHLTLKTHDNQLIQDDWDEYGVQSFKFEVLKIAKTEQEYEEMLDFEYKTIIDLRKRNVPIYNLSISKFNKITRNGVAKLLNKENSKKRFSKKWTIVYPDGREEEILNLRDFCRQNNLSHRAMADTADGITTQTRQGFKCKRGEGNVKRKCNPRPHLRGDGSPSSASYLIAFPDRHEEIIVGLKNFAKDNNLNYRSLWQTSLHGERSNHKGFKVKKRIK